MRRALLLSVALLAGCKGGNDYSAMAKAANKARGDVKNPAEQPAPAKATLLSVGQNSPRLLQAQGDSVFWLNEGGRMGPLGLFAVGKSGGKTVTLLEQPELSAMAVDATDVYFLAPRAGKLGKVPRTGGQPTILAEFEGTLRGMVIDDTDVYWAEDEGIHSVPKAGGKVKNVVAAALPDYLAVDGTSVYWYNSIAGVISRAPKKGGSASKVHADDKHTLHTFLIDGNDLFVSFGAEGQMELHRLGKGGGKDELVVDKQTPANGFAIDNNNIYWITDDTVFKVARGGGSAEPLVKGIEHGKDVAVDDQFVYWTDTSGRVQRLPK